MVESPVLYITFARPEYARQSFDAIKKAKPRKLYFYSNKGRAEKDKELERNDIIRSYIDEIDWECELKFFFRKEYVDVYTSLWGAIDWVFDNEKEAIIIEEDVVASMAFFDFCDQLLLKYRNSKEVWMISGDNAKPQLSPNNLNYFASRYTPIMGWAGWADRWKSMDREMKYWPLLKKSMAYYRYFGHFDMGIFHAMRFDKVYRNYMFFNPWDSVFFYNMIQQNKYSILPSLCLIDGIGFMGEHNKGNGMGCFKSDSQLKDKYPIDNIPDLIKPTSFDYKYFLCYYLKNFLRYRFTNLFRK